MHKIEVMRLLAVAPVPTGRKGERSRRAYETELKALTEIGIRVIHRATPLESLCLPTLSPGLDVNGAAARANQRLRTETVIARILIDRLRQQNILTWNQVEIPELAAPYSVFNGQVFTAHGYSYLGPLVRWNDGGKPVSCPVVIDCYLNTCSRMQVESLIERIERVSIRKAGRRRLLGILAARHFDPEAWKLARGHGFFTVNLRQQFGEEALEAMIQVEKLVHDIMRGESASDVASNFVSFADVIEELKKNPIVAELRAVGFEALTALILNADGYQPTTLGQIVPYGNTVRDVDVYGFRGDQLRIVECKAYHGGKSITPDEVKKFFTETVPALKNWLRTKGQQFGTCFAEIWTTGTKGKDAGDALYKLSRPKGDTWGIRRRDEICDYAPKLVKDRALQLLNSIALEEHREPKE